MCDGTQLLHLRHSLAFVFSVSVQEAGNHSNNRLTVMEQYTLVSASHPFGSGNLKERVTEP